MGSPCELLCEVESTEDAERLAVRVATEAWRIEDKLSRYISGNMVDGINSANGRPFTVDEETAQLLDFAATLHSLSGGTFDITSGVLRQVWTFDGGDRVPTEAEVSKLLGLVGWEKVIWRTPIIELPHGMEIDLGGIGKEYAVDRAILDLKSNTGTSCLVNFGGDLAVTGPPQMRESWSVGIAAVDDRGTDKLIKLRRGALATSGDARRFLLKDGVRYGHVIDPRSGWPVAHAASSITVAADSCTQAGMLATLGMLKGPLAEQFLDEQAEQYWCRREKF